jgi:hypothetical protein
MCNDLPLTIVEGLFLRRAGSVRSGAVQAAMVPPVEVFEDGELACFEAAPGPARLDQFGFDLTDGRLGEGVVVGVAAGSDGGDRVDTGQRVGVADRDVFDRRGRCDGSARRGVRRGSSSPSPVLRAPAQCAGVGHAFHTQRQRNGEFLPERFTRICVQGGAGPPKTAPASTGSSSMSAAKRRRPVRGETPSQCPTESPVTRSPALSASCTRSRRSASCN